VNNLASNMLQNPGNLGLRPAGAGATSSSPAQAQQPAASPAATSPAATSSPVTINPSK